MILHVKNYYGDINLNSIDLNHNKPPDISDTAPAEDGTKDYVMEMSAEELTQFLGDIVANLGLSRGLSDVNVWMLQHFFI